MKWYWVVLIIAVIQAIFLLVFWFIKKRSSDPGTEAKAGESVVKRMAEELEAERLAKVAVESQLKVLADDYKKIMAWYNEQRLYIGKRAQDEFQKLASNPSSIDDALSKLLGLGSDTPTGPDKKTETN